MPSKRKHTKSRLGCSQCKQRRIRCDQVAPRCGSCSKKGIECEYQDLAGAHRYLQILTQANLEASSSGYSSGRSSSLSSSKPTPDHETRRASADPAPRLFSSREMLLMHHFTLYTARTVGILPDPDLVHVWQVVVPDMACQCPFLLSALLSIASAHRGDYETARNDYSKAVALFTASASETLRASRPDLVFCYCVLVTLITFSFHCNDSSDPRSPIAGIVHVLGITRTGVDMLSAYYQEIRQSAIGALIRHLQPLPGNLQVPDDANSSLTLLMSTINEQAHALSSKDATALRETVSSLHRWYTVVTPRTKTWANVFQWTNRLSPDYSALLDDGHPAAMAIFCHWCVPVHHAPRRWEVGDWGKRVISAIAHALDGSVWRETVAWPVSEIARGGDVA